MAEANSSEIPAAGELQRTLIILGRIFSRGTDYGSFSEQLWIAVRAYLRASRVHATTEDENLRHLMIGYNLIGRLYQINVSGDVLANTTHEVESAGNAGGGVIAASLEQFVSFYTGPQSRNDLLRENVFENVDNDYEELLSRPLERRPSQEQFEVVNPEEMSGRNLSRYVFDSADNNNDENLENMFEDPLSLKVDVVGKIKKEEVDPDNTMEYGAATNAAVVVAHNEMLEVKEENEEEKDDELHQLMVPPDDRVVVPPADVPPAGIVPPAVPTRVRPVRQATITPRDYYGYTESSPSGSPQQSSVSFPRQSLAKRRKVCAQSTNSTAAICTACDKTFGTTSQLLKHSVVHADGYSPSDYPFHCKYCLRGFNTNGGLSCHLAKAETCMAHKIATAAAASTK